MGDDDFTAGVKQEAIAVTDKVEKLIDEKKEEVKQIVDDINNIIVNDVKQESEISQENPVELLPGEEVVVLSQGENKADKIIIRINETEEEKQAKLEAEEREKQAKLEAEAKIQTEKIAQEKKAQAIESVEEALHTPSVDELGLIINSGNEGK